MHSACKRIKLNPIHYPKLFDSIEFEQSLHYF